VIRFDVVSAFSGGISVSITETVDKNTCSLDWMRCVDIKL